MERDKITKIKVLRIIARLNIGGPSIHTILLSEGLDKNRFETLLVVGRPDEKEGDMSYLAENKDINIEYIPELGRQIGGSDIIAFIKLFRIINRFRPDIVHTHTAKAGTLGRVAAVFLGVKVKIHTFHGHVFHSYFGKIKTRIFILIERFLGLFTDYVITISDAQKKEIGDIYKIISLDKIRVIKLGFDLAGFKKGIQAGKVKKELGISPGAVVIGIIGRLVAIKDHKLFLDAAKILSDRLKNKDLIFLVVGDGELRGELEEYARASGIGTKVKFLGWRKDLAFIYADTDIVALTSFNEGTPVSLIEASYSGKPIVSTDVGSVKDVVIDKKNGFLVSDRDPYEFSQRIYDLIESPKLRLEMGKAGTELVANNYSKERLIKEVEDLYLEALSKK